VPFKIGSEREPLKFDRDSGMQKKPSLWDGFFVVWMAAKPSESAQQNFKMQIKRKIEIDFFHLGDFTMRDT